MEQFDNFNIVDIVIMVGLLVSGGLATLRGFVRETISLLAWILAILAVFRLTPLVAPQLSGYVSQSFDYAMPGWLATTTAAFVIFFAILLIFSMLDSYILRKMQRSGLGFVDRFLGFFFGIARGLLIFAGLYFLLSLALQPHEQPAWLAESRLRPILDMTIDWIAPLVRESFIPSSDIDLNEFMNPPSDN